MSVPPGLMTLGNMPLQASQTATQPVVMAESPAPNPGQQLWQDALSQYPILAKQNIAYSYQPPDIKNPPGKLEFYDPTEDQRPKDIPKGRQGIAVFNPNTKPSDLLADWVSHYGRKNDPTISRHYSMFVKSMTPKQKQKLQEQYQYAQKDRIDEKGNVIPGEKRPFKQWAEVSGIPAWYRGHLFNQWPKEFVQNMFEPAQIQMLNKIRPYLNMGDEK
jgi:hypothetical protein